MNFGEVKQLLDAGFTHDEIMSMINPQNPHDNPPAENTNNNPTDQENNSEQDLPHAADQETPGQDPAGVPAENTNNPIDAKFDQLNEMMQKVIKTIQTSNLQNNFTEGNRSENLDKQVDDIMKSIIRPEKEEKQ